MLKDAWKNDPWFQQNAPMLLAARAAAQKDEDEEGEQPEIPTVEEFERIIRQQGDGE